MKSLPVVKEWDCYDPSYPVNSIILYHGVPHKVIDAGDQGLRLAAIKDIRRYRAAKGVRMTYRLRMKFDAAHSLPHYEGECKNLHGHTWHVEFFIRVPRKRDADGIGTDFKSLKARLSKVLPDHKYLNNWLSFRKESPSAENLIQELLELTKGFGVKKIVLWESEDAGIEIDT